MPSMHYWTVTVACVPGTGIFELDELPTNDEVICNGETPDCAAWKIRTASVPCPDTGSLFGGRDNVTCNFPEFSSALSTMVTGWFPWPRKPPLDTRNNCNIAGSY